VLLSSHLIGELEALCDSFSVLSAGSMVWTGTAVELRAQARGSSYRIVTSDDHRAAELAAGRPGLLVEHTDDGSLTLTGEEGSLDEFVLALGRAGVAVRHLASAMNPLESVFALTGTAAAASPSEDGR
jgi:ABC-2 type transport system ATP-binding protein